MTTNDGMIYDTATALYRPGAVLAKLALLRAGAGSLEKKTKQGVNFEVRSYEDAIDQVATLADELGLLIYPVESPGHGVSYEWTNKYDKPQVGTLAEVTLTVRFQAIEDGSYVDMQAFGLGMDTQDKAGGKAGTYAFKQALIQGLLMGGSKNAKKLGVKDTDDEDGIAASGTRKTRGKKLAPSTDAAKAALASVTDKTTFDKAIVEVRHLPPDLQVTLRDEITAARAKLQPAA